MCSQAIKPRVSAIRYKLSKDTHTYREILLLVLSVCMWKIFKLENLTVLLHDFLPTDVKYTII